MFSQHTMLQDTPNETSGSSVSPLLKEVFSGDTVSEVSPSKEAEAGSSSAMELDKRPFHFEGKDFEDVQELAQSFCESEGTWQAALGRLDDVRVWLESDGRPDEAAALEVMLAKMRPNMALFHFIHTQARSPFIFMGKLIDINNLYLFLTRTASLEGTKAEDLIVNMMGNGQLSLLYEDYATLSGNRDPLLQQVILLMEKKAPAEQWICFEAFKKPEQYQWPEGFNTDDMEQNRTLTLKALSQIQTLPVKRAFLEDLQTRYALPAELLDQFKKGSTYAKGASKLKELYKQELLIPKGSDFLTAAYYEQLSVQEYTQRARAVCMGHTPEVLQKLNILLEVFPSLPETSDALETELLTHAYQRMKMLKDKKITAIDALSLTRMFDLFRQRHKIRKSLAVLLPISAFTGGMAFWLCSKFLSCSYTLLPSVLGIVLGAVGFYAFFRHSMTQSFRRIVYFCASYSAWTLRIKD